MSTGKDPKSMPGTDAFRDGYDRIFGKDHQPTRGKFIWDTEQQKFVPEGEYVAPATALNAPIMVDRFYEGVSITTADEKGRPLKVDIGSRMKHREYMKRTGLTTADDFKESWKPEAMAKRNRESELKDDAERRETIGRIDYEMENRRRR